MAQSSLEQQSIDDPTLKLTLRKKAIPRLGRFRGGPAAMSGASLKDAQAAKEKAAQVFRALVGEVAVGIMPL